MFGCVDTEYLVEPETGIGQSPEAGCDVGYRDERERYESYFSGNAHSLIIGRNYKFEIGNLEAGLAADACV
jgi:hypothetical protein